MPRADPPLWRRAWQANRQIAGCPPGTCWNARCKARWRRQPLLTRVRWSIFTPLRPARRPDAAHLFFQLVSRRYERAAC